VSDEENRKRFGAQARSHEHDWTVRVEVCGPIDPTTGFVTDLTALDEALDDLIGGWDGGDLNELIPDVKEGRMQPSTESLARWIHERLSAEISRPARMGRVYVWEGTELGAFYPAGTLSQ
jgi:6-pyruvoyltetrahydropterin/6-carboxytetrahydropterin synthase